MPPPAVISPEGAPDADSAADAQTECSSSSSAITCASNVDDLHSGDDPDAVDNASLHEELEDADSMDSAWTDSKHSSYLSFMEQNFVRDMYNREYCALDVCGQQSRHHRHVKEEHDPDSAESHVSMPCSPIEFKVWENGNWIWRVNIKRKRQPWALLSNPWVKHFRPRAACERDASNTTPPKNMKGGPPQLDAHLSSMSPNNSGSKGAETIFSNHQGFCRNESVVAKHCVELPLTMFGTSSPWKATARVKNGQASEMGYQSQFYLEQGNISIGVFGEICKKSNKRGDHSYDKHMLRCGDG